MQNAQAGVMWDDVMLLNNAVNTVEGVEYIHLSSVLYSLPSNDHRLPFH